MRVSKITILGLLAILFTFTMAGCSNTSTSKKEATASDTSKINNQ